MRGLRIGVSTSAILTLIAYRFMLSNLLPRLPYMTRSMMEILSELASYIDVPASHLAEHRATADIAIEDDTEAALGVDPLIRIHSGLKRPDDAFVSVKYREHWFWIDDCDIKSKKVFSFLMFLFTLAETGMPEQVPVLTIPTR